VIYRGRAVPVKGGLISMRGRVLPSAVKVQVDTPELLDLLSESSGFLLAPSKLLFHSPSLIVAREQIREKRRIAEGTGSSWRYAGSRISS